MNYLSYFHRTSVKIDLLVAYDGASRAEHRRSCALNGETVEIVMWPWKCRLQSFLRRYFASLVIVLRGLLPRIGMGCLRLGFGRLTLCYCQAKQAFNIAQHWNRWTAVGCSANLHPPSQAQHPFVKWWTQTPWKIRVFVSRMMVRLLWPCLT